MGANFINSLGDFFLGNFFLNLNSKTILNLQIYISGFFLLIFFLNLEKNTNFQTHKIENNFYKKILDDRICVVWTQCDVAMCASVQTLTSSRLMKKKQIWNVLYNMMGPFVLSSRQWVGCPELKHFVQKRKKERDGGG
jgi:hypothetical protein